ncbi:MAG TPA: phosphate uptake regulator PhoU, partial [Actinobacteria bacterium]|nr:phosphate uptake regulator PhoU [Actinomycetota bacterium]
VSTDIEIVKQKSISEIMGRMGVSTKGMLLTAMEAFETQDRAMAAKLDTKDNQIDDLYRQLIKELFKLEKESSLELAVSMALTGRYFERIADHAVNIAIWANYLATGNLPG